ncbi:MAG TPA: NfeD family protein [Gemmatimonadales bacterium]|nr:NfeD family protein [Gemmatimonadales bacterium]
MSTRRVRMLACTPCLVMISCAHPQPMNVLGPDPSYAPHVIPLATKRGVPDSATVELARPAFVTLLEVEDGRVILRFATAEPKPALLAAGTHRLALRAMPPSDSVSADLVAAPPAGLARGTPTRVERLGHLPQEICPTSDPDHPSYCPVSPTEALTKPLVARPSRYLLLIAAADPLTVATLRARLRDADLALHGRELVAEIALRASGGRVDGERWAAVAVAL